MAWTDYLLPSVPSPTSVVTAPWRWGYQVGQQIGTAGKSAYQTGASKAVEYLSPDAAAAIREEEQRKLQQQFWSKNGVALGVLAFVLVLVWMKRGRERRGS